jgi:hypothetical protein
VQKSVQTTLQGLITVLFTLPALCAQELPDRNGPCDATVSAEFLTYVSMAMRFTDKLDFSFATSTKSIRRAV